MYSSSTSVLDDILTIQMMCSVEGGLYTPPHVLLDSNGSLIRLLGLYWDWLGLVHQPISSK